jgi:phospholipase C
MIEDAMSSEAALERLQKINHIVVLMMENRSFDQMLGYLKEAGLPDVEGLSPDMSNPDDQGVEQKVFRWGNEETAFHPADDATGAPLDPKILDPCHGPGCVEEQLAGGNRGFVTNFLKSRPEKDRDGKPIQVPQRYRSFPMGYYTGEHLPVYDHLARQFSVCDRWHASVPGDTWLNRCYALAGSTSEPVGHKIGLLDRFKRRAMIGKLRQLPIFDVEAFTRHLDNERWRWYSHDPATLRASDSQYRRAWHLSKDNFAYFDRRRVSFVTEAAESLITAHDSFLDDAAKGQLGDLAWIDPNFVDLSVFDPSSNDDHPPSDVRAGQQLVLETYEALANSPQWEDTLLVITYDEHGGFFDHVVPPAVSDGSPYKTLGVRVPALVVGPRVRKFVCHDLFDHTSLIKTILLRFAGQAAIDAMTLHVGHQRIERANHLGLVLEDEPRTDLPDRGPLHGALSNWREEARRQRHATAGALSPIPGDGAGHKQELNQLSQEVTGFAIEMRRRGLPAGQP